MRLKDKIVLVTASTRGIGLACVKACAMEGANVYMAARNPEAANAIAEELNRQGGTVACVYNDASDPDSFYAMVEEVVEKEAAALALLRNNTQK